VHHTDETLKDDKEFELMGDVDESDLKAKVNEVMYRRKHIS
jgi:hypothetical protein